MEERDGWMDGGRHLEIRDHMEINHKNISTDINEMARTQRSSGIKERERHTETETGTEHTEQTLASTNDYRPLCQTTDGPAPASSFFSLLSTFKRLSFK